MNKFVGWSLGHHAKDSKCGKCGMKEKKNGCCKDNHTHVKLKTDHQKATCNIDCKIYDSEVSLPLFYKLTHSKPILYIPENFPNINAPPLWQKIPIYLRNRVFRI